MWKIAKQWKRLLFVDLFNNINIYYSNIIVIRDEIVNYKIKWIIRQDKFGFGHLDVQFMDANKV